MKAWYVTNADAEEGGDIIFADTRGKAKYVGFRSLDFEEFTEVRVSRAPKADGEPHKLTPQEWLDIGYGYCCWSCDGPVYSEDEYVIRGEQAFHTWCVPQKKEKP